MEKKIKRVEDTKTLTEYAEFCQRQDIRMHLERLEYCSNKIKAMFQQILEDGDDMEIAKEINMWLDEIKKEAGRLQTTYGDGF